MRKTYFFSIVLMLVAFVSQAQISGTFQVGEGTSDDYPTLYEALIDLYAEGMDGAVVFELSADYNSAAETYPIYIQEVTGSTFTNTLTIKPAEGVDVTWEFPTVDEMSAVIGVIDASNVIIDGSNNGTDSRNLTIINNATIGEVAPVALFTDVAPGDNITVKNCILKANGSDYESAGIYVDRYTNVTIENNEISNADIGIMVNEGSDFLITNNAIGSDVEAEYLKSGIGVVNAQNYTISKNFIHNLYAEQGDGNIHAVALYMGGGAIEVSQNVVQNVVHMGDSASQALAFYELDANTLKIVNNHIAGVASDVNEDNFPAAIAVLCPAMTNGIKMNYNSVYMSENNDYGIGGISGDYITAPAIAIGGGTGIIMKNNIFHNALGERDGSTESTYGVAVMCNEMTSPFSQIENNIYYVEGDYDYSYLAFTVEGPKNLADWQTWTGQETNSIYADPLFVATDDLNVQKCSPAIVHGVTMNGVNVDINDSTRHATNPTIGAYEYQMMQAKDIEMFLPVKDIVYDSFFFTAGNGCRRAVFAKEGDATLDPAMPVNGTTYTPSITFGEGSEIGTTGWYCMEILDEEIYGTGFYEFTEYQDYTIMICEYFGADGDEFYITETENNNPYLFTAMNVSVTENTNQISIYPNPTSGILNLTGLQNQIGLEIRIYDITGRELIRTQFTDPVGQKIDVSQLSKGTYILKIGDATKKFEVN